MSDTYIEYDSSLTERLTRKQALIQRITYRLQVRKNEIPFFSKGLDIKEFSYKDPTASITDVLRDITSTISVEQNRIVVADISVEIPISVLTGETDE